MRGDIPGYDNYLTREWERREAETNAYIDFCDEHDLDPDAPQTADLFEEWLEEQAELEAERRMEDHYESIAEKRAERIAEGW